MWLFTKFGFFSVVNKGDNDELTVRSRTKSDLDRLRNHYLPSLSPPSAHEGTDYPWRATTSSTALGEAMRVIAQDIDYANFKDEVALGLGKDRAKRYGKIWSALYDMPDDLREPHPDGFEGLPQLNEVHHFATAVLLGSNSVTHPELTLRDFNWKLSKA